MNRRRMRVEGDLTFRPLHRKRFRCNQTNALVKNCSGYARMVTNKGKKFHNGIPKDAIDLPQVKLSVTGMWKCPYTHPWHTQGGNYSYSDKKLYKHHETCGRG